LLWKQGAYMAVVNLLIYSTVGMAWWKMLGLW
jgi:DASS family divalent anion:Na+ symporter